MSKVLIIEDEKTLNEAYQIVLKKAKHKVFTAFNGQEGLEVFKAERPDLV
jgi:DNA-binding response OmpR family regulator